MPRLVLVTIVALSLNSSPARACPDCEVGRQARALVVAQLSWSTLAPLLAVVAILVALIAAIACRSRLASAGAALGMGLGGFIDGIVLHQLLQWHNLFSSRVAPVDLTAMKYNMAWDGVFHLLTWLLTVGGLALLWRETRDNGPSSTAVLIGASILGWGLFNVVEGLIDHQVAGIHHVRPGPDQLAWDVGFLAVGALQVLVGWVLLRAADHPPRTSG